MKASADLAVSFDRLDERLPFPIPDEARAIVAFDPTILEMSQYLLKVKGLAADDFELKIDGNVVGTVTGKELAAGINLTAFGPGSAKSPNPIAAQGRDILGAVSTRAKIVNQWRGMSKAATAPDAPAEARAKFDEMTKRVNEADDRIREAARPRKMHFELKSTSRSIAF